MSSNVDMSFASISLRALRGGLVQPPVHSSGEARNGTREQVIWARPAEQEAA